jgi:hypothetical protein
LSCTFWEIGGNGASMEGPVQAVFNEMSSYNSVPDLAMRFLSFLVGTCYF